MSCDVKAGRCQGSKYQLLLTNIISPAPTTGNTIERIRPKTKKPKTTSLNRFKSFMSSVRNKKQECPDPSFSCGDLATCCPLKQGWGCCPLGPDAVCCEDLMHCCPKGKTCHPVGQDCV